ncbi:bifunctional 4-hydroxy-2-oxoglutarate aldolase/2-dehydro-3-deoxy-phosphogluconate aldolase [Salinisphaera sp. G21_0]|uniref:bifunctional 4-hydroxy-2-oxoglutarate aldolase/2-dehydro-3-deoxy-phosphogluconate aldolase n=1 Tax=Salinisphaera sp. G21_0 TaxID=2821094 RepID=UPI001AD9E491|nr:bifunctional 4-hydroxy-2-oxoglutarate aldolase/2-dehydro-3-deoxy-phosphogluconate aldolase [Salinisphaera sp. G21_0]MBO9482912.1 bifunctional 4-hydroxy-2-oxoglutarate aldolase/2-dehydro-3-deoxy-phosphogluconate aldolase [Salinisphaera sp. G21_0]
MLTARDVLNRAFPVMPVMVIDDIDQALPMARALYDGGISVFEVTLRSECAVAAIQRIKQEMPDCLVGAGTVVNPEQLLAVHQAGADFVISPGATPALLAASREQNILLLPGVSSPSEVMQALDYGFDVLKLFPAEAVGGQSMLKSLAGPFPQVTFCPTGGINPENYQDYLALDNVLCVGGSWLVPKSVVESGNWREITLLAKQLAR